MAISIVKFFLWGLSGVYYCLIAFWGFLFKINVLKVYHIPCPIISVGNLTVGGTGKTPLIEFLVETLQNKGVQTAILTRGYMGGEAGSKPEHSDEVQMLKNTFPEVPVLVGSDRVKSAQSYLEDNTSDIFFLDDGFQHRRLFRDIDIVVIDATDPWGNGWLLPRGILREPKSALKRAQIFVLTKTDLGKDNREAIIKDLRSKYPETLIVETIHKPVLFFDVRSKAIVDIEEVSGKDVCAISSIGNPDSFTRTLIGLEINIEKHFAFMDHRSYKREDVENVVQLCQAKGVTTVVTTEKDAVKLKHFLDIFPKEIQVLSLRIRIVITEGEEQFLERIDRIL